VDTRLLGPWWDRLWVIRAVVHSADLLEDRGIRQLGFTGLNTLHEVHQPPKGLEPVPGRPPVQQSHRSPLGLRWSGRR
jgi:hypothetical protein